MKNTITIGLLCLLITSCKPSIPGIENCKVSKQYPQIFPLYNDVTIPPNIAPLDFEQTTDKGNIYALIEGEKDGRIDVT